MIIEAPQETKGTPFVLLHSITYPEVSTSRKPVVSLDGHMIGGPDRRGSNTPDSSTVWKAWQQDVQAAARREGAVPQVVMDYFQRTKHLATPPKGGDVTVYASNPPAQLLTEMQSGCFEVDLLAPMTTERLDVLIDIVERSDPLASLISDDPAPPARRLANPPRFATSFSGMQEFMLCPRKFAASKYFKTVKYVQSEAAADGDRGHKTAENYLLNAQGKSLPVDAHYLPRVQKYCDMFIKSGAKILVEQEMCCTRELKPCGWWDKEVWFRNRGDVITFKELRMKYFDWKFGKLKDDVFQIEVAIALADIHFGDQFEEADGKLIFVKESDPKKALVGLPKPITKADIPRIWERILTITDRMERAWQEENFRMTPNFLCKGYCDDFTCPHNGRR